MASEEIKLTTPEDSQHTGDVTKIVLHDNLLYSAGADGKVKIWDLDLNLKKELAIHDIYITGIVLDKSGKLYTASNDGSIKCCAAPLESEEAVVLLEDSYDEIEGLYVDDHGRFFWGDSRGGVTCFEDGKKKFTLNVVEHVKSVYLENDLLYTVLNYDTTVHELRDKGRYITKAHLPGKFPAILFGEKVEGQSKYIAITTEEGNGLTIYKNGIAEKFAKVTTKLNVHEENINAVRGCGDILFSCDFNGIVVKSKFDGSVLKEVGKATTDAGPANCIAVLDDNSVFVGSNDGSIKKIVF